MFTYLCKSRQIFLATDISTLYKSAPTTGVSPVHGTGASVIGLVAYNCPSLGRFDLNGTSHGYCLGAASPFGTAPPLRGRPVALGADYPHVEWANERRAGDHRRADRDPLRSGRRRSRASSWTPNIRHAQCGSCAYRAASASHRKRSATPLRRLLGKRSLTLLGLQPCPGHP